MRATAPVWDSEGIQRISRSIGSPLKLVTAARIGKPQAITATARELAILVYRALNGVLVYRDPGADAYDGQQGTRVLRRLRQRAATLGFELVNRETGEVLPAAVS